MTKPPPPAPHGLGTQPPAAEAPRSRRINPYAAFHSAPVPLWLLRRSEISNGAKLLYGLLAWHAGQNGDCYPKQSKAALELAVGERTVRGYLRELEQHGLVSWVQMGLQKPNRYFFADHPWSAGNRDQRKNRADPSAPDRLRSSAPDRRHPTGPPGGEHYPLNRGDTHATGGLIHSLPPSEDDPRLLTVEAAAAIAVGLGIDPDFARGEFHARAAVGWLDGYGNRIVSWSHHLQARWPTEQRKRAERAARTPRVKAPCALRASPENLKPKLI